MARRRKNRDVELFNFSFLDILACIIGLLIFILSIVVVSGSPNRPRQRPQVADSERQLQRNRLALDLASQRRSHLEAVLLQASRDFRDPTAAADAVRAETRAFEEEASKLQAAAVAALAQQQALQQKLAANDSSPKGSAAIQDIQAQIKHLDEMTAAIQRQIEQARTDAQKNVQRVQYYIPHRKEVQRRPLVVELAGDRLWCVNSADYDVTDTDEDSSRHTRRPGAPGTSISGIVSGKARLPEALEFASPQDTVLQIALHTDGFASFRSFREWAWAQGYSVDWFPQEGNSIILGRVTHVFEQ